jgi:hypothetical protein
MDQSKVREQVRGLDQTRIVALVCFGLLMLIVGVYVGDSFQSRQSWGDGYKTGYGKCEIDFWMEQRAVLERRKHE